MRETALRAKLEQHLGYPYVLAWSDSMVLAGIGQRTVTQALAAGVPCGQIWLAACVALELADHER
ncbi:MAG TPA: DUF3046 domain-containing protein [Propionicimonas sp.]|nr:DUF3046 domain-containing protein [Propionicimonas sp.]HRA05045.1 DUF3046 domain-containing protein [Propionicimonas sp.]